MFFMESFPNRHHLYNWHHRQDDDQDGGSGGGGVVLAADEARGNDGVN